MAKSSVSLASDLQLLAPFWREQVERVVLPNGLTLVLKPDRSAALASVQVWVKTGSQHEDAYLGAGLSHYLEHMLFKGTTRRAGREISATVQAHGGNINAYTTFDRTVYYIDLPSEHTAVAIDLLADAVLHSTLPADETTKEKEVILREIAMTKDDPENRLWDSLFATAFREHPYRQPIIGHKDVFSAVTREDLLSFYKTYYRPDTTTLVIVGDVNAQQAVSQIKAAFGDWKNPAGPKPVVVIPDVPAPAKAPATQVIAIPDTPQTSILFGYNGGLKQNNPDYYAAQIMNFIVGGSVFGSRLGKIIRDDNGLAYSVSSGIQAQHGSGPYQFFVGTNPKNATRALNLLRQTLSQIKQYGVTPDEIEQAKLYITGSYPIRLETNAGVASVLLMAQDNDLGLDFPYRRNALYNAVTPAQVKVAIQKYLRPSEGALIIAGAAPE